MVTPPKRPTPPAGVPKEQPRPQRKPHQQVLLDSAPWMPPRYELADVSAWKALQQGVASPEQQQRALRWLIAAAGTYDLSFRPGEDGSRASTFAEGKRFVGLQVVKLLNADLATLRRSEPLGDQYEPKE